MTDNETETSRPTPRNASFASWLPDWIERNGGVSGTVHSPVDAQTLELVTAYMIPPPVVAKITRIPIAKGMAGLAWSRRQPVDTCDLPTDDSGDVQPGAKAVRAGAAVAIPVFAPSGSGDSALLGVVGIAFAASGSIAGQRMADLVAQAAAAPWASLD